MLATFMQHSMEVLDTEIRQEKKGIWIRKKEIRLTLFEDDIIYTENLKDSTKRTVRSKKWIQ